VATKEIVVIARGAVVTKLGQICYGAEHIFDRRGRLKGIEFKEFHIPDTNHPFFRDKYPGLVDELDGAMKCDGSCNE
jgi:hypothetical protein